MTGPLVDLAKLAENDLIMLPEGTFPQDAIVVLEMQDEHVLAYPCGGGRNLRIPFADIRGRGFVLANNMTGTLRRGKFSLDDTPSFEGYTFGRLWNGWATPLFTRDGATAVLQSIIGDPGDPDVDDDSVYNAWTFDAEREVFRVWDRGDMRTDDDGVEHDGWHDVEVEEHEFAGADDGSGYVRVYDISDGWCWWEDKDDDKL